MPITEAEFIALQPGVNQSQQARAEREQDKLRDFLRGKAIDANISRAQQQAKSMGLQPGRYSMQAGEGSFSINPEAQVRPVMALTPAQEAAEKKTGALLSEYLSGGGKPSQEQNIKQAEEVLSEIEGGGRSGLERIAGGLTQGSESLMGLLVPGEKARRDKLRNAALNIVKTSVGGNPTLKEVEAIFGQVYDPSSDDATNLVRIRQFVDRAKQMSRQTQEAAKRYQDTGYATLGAGAPTEEAPAVSAPPSSDPAGDARRKRIQELKQKLGR